MICLHCRHQISFSCICWIIMSLAAQPQMWCLLSGANWRRCIPVPHGSWPFGQENGEAGRCNSGVKRGTFPSFCHRNMFCRKLTSESNMVFASRALILLHDKPAQNLVVQLFLIIFWVDWYQLCGCSSPCNVNWRCCQLGIRLGYQVSTGIITCLVPWYRRQEDPTQLGRWPFGPFSP